MNKREIFFMGLLCATGLGLIGCEDDNAASDTTETSTVKALTEAQYLEAKAATEAITGVSGEAFLTNTEANKQAGTYKIVDCAQRSSEELNGQITITLDYGEGCQLGDGDTVSGVIKITYDKNDTDNGATILTTLENYRYNDISVTGNASSLYTISEKGGNFIFSSETDFSFEWPDGLSAISDGLSETETVFEISDDTFDFYTLISGNGSTAFSNGDNYSYEITTPLRSEIGCAYIVSGVISSTENNSTLTRDYGEGNCDNIATETDDNGNTIIVNLDGDKEMDENT